MLVAEELADTVVDGVVVVVVVVGPVVVVVVAVSPAVVVIVVVDPVVAIVVVLYRRIQTLGASAKKPQNRSQPSSHGVSFDKWQLLAKDCSAWRAASLKGTQQYRESYLQNMNSNRLSWKYRLDPSTAVRGENR